MSVIALVDWQSVGHHQMYLGLITKAFLEQGHQVLACSPKPEALQEFIRRTIPQAEANLVTQQLTERHDNAAVIQPFREELTAKGARRWEETLNVLNAATARSGLVPDFVFFPKLDAWLQGIWTSAAAERFPYPWSGIYFHPLHFRQPLAYMPLRRGWLEPDAVLRTSRCYAVAALDEFVAVKLHRKIGKPVFHFPDITDESAPDLSLPVVQEIQRLAKGRKIVGLLGALEDRKGIFTLLEAAKKAVGESYFFLFAGESVMGESDMKKFIAGSKKAEENCYFQPGRIADEKAFNSLVALCDVIFAVYKGYPFSSNLMTKAALMRKPILVATGALLESRVLRYRTGLAVPEQDSDAVLAAIRTVSGADYTQSVQPQYETYFAQHSREQLGHVLAGILSASGI
ncbi:MAG: hypothetical protein IAF08_14235 [Rhizobacter sp.]|nr:hypothetical protein [Chlorobiales bacterium]